MNTTSLSCIVKKTSLCNIIDYVIMGVEKTINDKPTKIKGLFEKQIK